MKLAATLLEIGRSSSGERHGQEDEEGNGVVNRANQWQLTLAEVEPVNAGK